MKFFIIIVDIFPSQYTAICVHGGWSFDCFSVNKCLIRIAILCASGSFIFMPPLFLGRNSVFLAIGSAVLFCHKYWNIFVCIFCVIFSGMGKTLLKKVVLAKINVFIRIDFPYSESCLVDIFRIWFSIFVRMFCQLNRIISFKSSEKLMPRMSIYWYCCSIFVFFKFLYFSGLVCIYW